MLIIFFIFLNLLFFEVGEGSSYFCSCWINVWSTLFIIILINKIIYFKLLSKIISLAKHA